MNGVLSQKSDLFVSLVHGDEFLMIIANDLPSYKSVRKILTSTVILSTAIVAGCNNSKPVKLMAIPTPEPASLHRVSLADVGTDEQGNPSLSASQTQTLAHLPANTSNKTKFSTRTFGVKSSPRVQTTRGVRKGGGRYQIGKPYTIRGKKYYPKLDPNLKQTGLASWYGPNFHGRLTANGEVYDQYGLSAAHPTMPLPSYAKVTNLENGSSVMVRVNDRGPFSKRRVIDLSARAAQLLGYTKQGVAKVKVEYAGKAPLHGLDEQMLIASYNPGRVNPDLIPPLPGRNVLLAQTTPRRTIPTQNQINSVTSVGFAPPVPSLRIDNIGTTVPRPTALVNSFVQEERNSNATRAFNLIDGHRKLDEPQTGMKNLVHLQFGPFGDTTSEQKAEKLFETSGIVQIIDGKSAGQSVLLLIVAEEETGSVLEAAKTAGIKRYTTK